MCGGWGGGGGCHPSAEEDDVAKDTTIHQYVIICDLQMCINRCFNAIRLVTRAVQAVVRWGWGSTPDG